MGCGMIRDEFAREALFKACEEHDDWVCSHPGCLGGEIRVFRPNLEFPMWVMVPCPEHQAYRDKLLREGVGMSPTERKRELEEALANMMLNRQDIDSQIENKLEELRVLEGQIRLMGKMPA